MVLIKYGPVHCELRAFFFFSSRRRHTRWPRDWSSDVCSSDLTTSWLVHPAGLSIRTRPWPDGSVLGWFIGGGDRLLGRRLLDGSAIRVRLPGVGGACAPACQFGVPGRGLPQRLLHG